MALVDAAGHGVAELGSQYPIMPIGFDDVADHALRRACRIYVGRIDEVHAVFMGLRHDACGFERIGLVAKHHGAKA